MFVHVQVSFYHAMVCREHTFWQGLPLRAENITKKSYLALSYAVDKRLGVGHGMYDGVGDTVFPLDTQHEPIIARSCKEIDFAVYILWQHPGLTAIEKNGHTGGVE